MANVNSLTSNSYSSSTSLYGNRNVLTGLASGMDTEAMIQNSVTGYQTKIQELQQSQEKLEWKQDAYREIIDQMYGITNKYTSYTSTTNLSSNSFFTNNVSTTANGSNAGAVTATGKASSDIQINAVTQLATSARYAVDASALSVKTTNDTAGSAIKWEDTVKKGVLSGTMTLKLGSNTVDLRFTEDDKYESLEDLVKGINDKLADIGITSKKDGSIKAGDVITASLGSDGSINFKSNSSDGDSAYISGVSGNLRELMDVQTATSSADEKRFTYTSFSLKDGKKDLTESLTMAKYLSGKTIDVTLDGTTKSIKIGDLTKGTTEELQADLQKSIDKAFGANKLTVSVADGGLKFDVSKDSGSTVKITSSVGKELGMEDGLSNYFNTSQKLGNLLGEDWLNANARIEGTVDPDAEVRYYDEDGNQVKKDGLYYLRVDSKGNYILKDGSPIRATSKVHEMYTDADGNLLKKDGNSYYRANEKGEFTYGLEINGTTIDGFTKDTALESVLNKINSNAEAGVKVSYSNLTSQFVFTANETGEGGKIEFGDGLAMRLFGGSKSALNAKLSDVFGSDFFDENGNATLYFGNTSRFEIKGLTKDSTMQEFMTAFNKAQSAVKAEFDEGTGKFTLDQTYPGSYFHNSKDASTASMYVTEAFSGEKTGYVGTSTAGQDAVVKATVNGKELTLKRSSNVIDMDGMSVTLKDEFSAYDEDGKINSADVVTFKTSSNSDAIVDAIKSFVEDVNKLMTSVHSAVTTQPLTKSTSSGNGSSYSHKSGYEPLTEDDKNSMSEDAVKKYEEKAKTGLLFGDTDLRTLYDKLLTGIQSYGTDRIDMEAIGLTTTYSNGATTLQLNEEKLRAALDSDPDKVRNVFTKTKEGGSATEGLMSTLKSTLNAYGSTSLASPGILVRKAGTKLSAVSLLNNNIQSQISGLDSQIESWQTKLSNRIDYYTKQFTQLEQLMSTMNNQSSMLADLMGY